VLGLGVDTARLRPVAPHAGPGPRGRTAGLRARGPRPPAGPPHGR